MVSAETEGPLPYSQEPTLYPVLDRINRLYTLTIYSFDSQPNTDLLSASRAPRQSIPGTPYMKLSNAYLTSSMPATLPAYLILLERCCRLTIYPNILLQVLPKLNVYFLSNGLLVSEDPANVQSLYSLGCGLEDRG
jgi:hypothetical protein